MRAMLRTSLLLVLVASTARAQAPAFDVATIKPSAAVANWSGFQVPSAGRFEGSYDTVKDMVAWAYQVPDFYVSGGPGWASADRFEIVAEMDATAKTDQARLMLRTLLTERFQLALRRETKQVTVYRLTVAKGGLKLPQAERKAGGIRFRGRGQIEGMGIDAAGLARYLQTLLGQVVEDKTGLTGDYDFKLSWTPDESQTGKPGTQAQLNGPPAEENGPSIFTALQEQLGLRLESSKQPVETLVIESVEKPSAN